VRWKPRNLVNGQPGEQGKQRGNKNTRNPFVVIKFRGEGKEGSPLDGEGEYIVKQHDTI
jgi:hypothetical protein